MAPDTAVRHPARMRPAQRLGGINPFLRVILSMIACAGVVFFVSPVYALSSIQPDGREVTTLLPQREIQKRHSATRSFSYRPQETYSGFENPAIVYDTDDRAAASSNSASSNDDGHLSSKVAGSLATPAPIDTLKNKAYADRDDIRMFRHITSVTFRSANPPQPSDFPPEPTPRKIPYITRWAAIGDSYAAGVGSGSQVHAKCSRYSDSYPMQLSRTDLFSENFQFLACSGDKMTQIMAQVRELKYNLQFLTISAGGNDMQLLRIINSCLIHYNVFDLQPCASLVNDVALFAQSVEFRAMLTALLDAALKKLAPDGLLIWTGYVTLFNIDDNRQCDSQTWCIWKNLHIRPFGVKLPPANLTEELRIQMNYLVSLCNDAIERAINLRGDKRAMFIRYEQDFTGGRFCEKDPRREGLYFFSPTLRHLDADRVAMDREEILRYVEPNPEHNVESILRNFPDEYPRSWDDEYSQRDPGVVLPVAAAAIGQKITGAPISTYLPVRHNSTILPERSTASTILILGSSVTNVPNIQTTVTNALSIGKVSANAPTINKISAPLSSIHSLGLTSTPTNLISLLQPTTPAISHPRLEKRLSFMHFRTPPIARLADVLTSALHFTSAGSSIVTRHLYREAFTWVTAKKLAEREPTFQSAVICASDMAGWNRHLVPISILRDVAEEFCGQLKDREPPPPPTTAARSGMARSGQVLQQHGRLPREEIQRDLAKMTLRRNVEGEGNVKVQVVADVTLVSRVGPDEKFTIWRAEGKRLGIEEQYGERDQLSLMLPLNLTEQYCGRAMKSIIDTCDLHRTPNTFVAGGSLIDGAATWRISVQQLRSQHNLPRSIPDTGPGLDPSDASVCACRTQNTTIDVPATEVKRSQAALGSQNPFRYLRKIIPSSAERGGIRKRSTETIVYPSDVSNHNPNSAAPGPVNNHITNNQENTARPESRITSFLQTLLRTFTSSSQSSQPHNYPQRQQLSSSDLSTFLRTRHTRCLEWLSTLCSFLPRAQSQAQSQLEHRISAKDNNKAKDADEDAAATVRRYRGILREAANEVDAQRLREMLLQTSTDGVRRMETGSRYAEVAVASKSDQAGEAVGSGAKGMGKDVNANINVPSIVGELKAKVKRQEPGMRAAEKRTLKVKSRKRNQNTRMRNRNRKKKKRSVTVVKQGGDGYEKFSEKKSRRKTTEKRDNKRDRDVRKAKGNYHGNGNGRLWRSAAVDRLMQQLVVM